MSYRNVVFTTREAYSLNKEEFEAAREYFDVSVSRVIRDAWVIPRYSALPHFADLEADVGLLNSSLFNTRDEFEWVSKFHYYDSLKDLTFSTWRQNEFFRCQHPGPFVVKGVTNSKKYQWATHMFANTKADAIRVLVKLQEDTHFNNQEIIIRKFEPLVSFEEGIDGLNFSNEHRFFFMGNHPIAHGYYWSEAENVDVPTPPAAIEFAQTTADRVAKIHPNLFFVVDVAEKKTGGWIMVELNHGFQSGLGCINPSKFYRGLHNYFSKWVNP